MLPVASPALRQARRRRSRSPATSRSTCCCTSTIPRAARRGSTGRRGSPRTAQPGLKPAGSLRFTLYDQVIQAAVGGQGVALGRIPLIAELLRDGRLVAPFPKRYDSPRGYYALVAPHAARGPRSPAFVAWLRSAARSAHDAPASHRATRNTARRDAMTPCTHDRFARAVAVDRALRAARRAGRARARPRRAATAATRASSPRAARRSSRSIAMPTALAALARRRRASRRARVDLETRRVAARRRALRRDRRRRTTCTGRCSRICAPRWPTTACCSTRRSRWATRRTAGRPIPTFLLCRDELLSIAALPPAADGGRVRAGRGRTAGGPAVVQRLAAVGPRRRPWPPGRLARPVATGRSASANAVK